MTPPQALELRCPLEYIAHYAAHTCWSLNYVGARFSFERSMRRPDARASVERALASQRQGKTHAMRTMASQCRMKPYGLNAKAIASSWDPRVLWVDCGLGQSMMIRIR